MPSLRFGDNFELDAGAYQLRRSGQALRLERIPMEILLLLTERRGQLVTREQIVERVWGKDANLDVDNSINGAIRKIRQVLKDDPEQPRFIQTVTGRGYRFAAPLRVSEPIKAAPPPPAPKRRWLVPASALVLLVGAVAVTLVATRSRVVPPEKRAMIAVLPFDNLTGDARQEYFSDGLTEEMITQLGARDPEHLSVIARTSVMRYKRDRPALDQIARELGIQYVLEGSVRRDANQVRVTAQLIRAADQTQLWARQYDRQPADLLTLQGEIAAAIANEIQSSLGRPPATLRSDSLEPAHAFPAYDAYLKGAYYLNKRTVLDIQRAIRFFQEATVTDPTYARAFAALANANSLLVGYSQLPPQPLIAEARGAALRALELDPSLPEAHTAYALIVENHEWDWKTAEREYLRAIELNPNYATAHHWYAEFLMWRGRFDEALVESERARRLDPLSLIIAADNGAILFYSRRYPQAIEKWRSILQIDPDFPRAHSIVWAYVENKMFPEAFADMARQRPWVGEPTYWAGLAYVYGRAGRQEEGRAALGHLFDAMRRQPVQSGAIAGAYAGLGDTAKAMDWLERAYAERSNDMCSLKVNPMFDALRRNPRYQRLLERVGLSGT